MAVHHIDGRGLPLRSARDWSNYAGHLAGTRLVQRYPGAVLRAWVESSKVSNPLAIPWVRILFRSDLLPLESRLRALVNALGEDNLAPS